MSYIESLDETNVREEAVSVLNPITLPQSPDSISVDAMIQYGGSAYEIASLTGIAEIGGTLASASGTVGAEGSLKVQGLKATIAAVSNLGPRRAPDSELTATSELTGQAIISEHRFYRLRASPQTDLYVTVSIPYNPRVVKDLSLRLWMRPLVDPLLTGSTDLDATLTVSPTAIFSAAARMVDYRKHKFLNLSDPSQKLVANLLANLRRKIGIMSSLTGPTDLWARPTYNKDVVTDDIVDPDDFAMEITAAANAEFTLRKRAVHVVRTAAYIDTRLVTAEDNLSVDPFSDTVTVEVDQAGWVVIDLSSLLQDDRFVYSFRVSTDDPAGFIVYDKEPMYPDRDPSFIFGPDRRSPRQQIAGAYLGQIVSHTEHTGSYPVPYFTVSEARRLATAWNAVAAYSPDPADRYTLEYDSNSQQFAKVLEDPDTGEIEVLDTIDGVRLGNVLVFPIGSWDWLWAIDKSDAVSKQRTILAAAADFDAIAES